MIAPVIPAPTTGAGPRGYTLQLPAGLPLLNSNQRPHHRQKAKLTAAIRAAAFAAVHEHPELMTALRAAGPEPLMQHAHMVGIVHPQRRGRFDPPNWWPSFKAFIDGLVDAGVLEDDDHTRLIGPLMVPGQPVKGGQLEIRFREITAAEHTALTAAALGLTAA